jgi:hypothetical protein
MNNNNFFNINNLNNNRNTNNNLNNNSNNNSNNNINKKTKIMDENSFLHKYQYLLSIVLVGYFGIKIFLGSFNKYPEKFYEKQLIIKSNELCGKSEEKNNTTDNLVLNYFIPGLINNEIYDIVITVILISVLFVITGMYKRNSFGMNGITNFMFIIGYLIGLNAPLYKSFFEEGNNSLFINYVYLITFIILMGCMCLFSALGSFRSNYLSLNGGLSGYILYLIIFSLLIIGLIFTKKKIKTSNAYYYMNNTLYNSNNICDSNKKLGGYQSSGEYIKVSMTFLSYILLFIFVYDPFNNDIMNSSYYIVNGLLFGIFISGMSFYGFEYFLNKKPDIYCNNEEDCKLKNIKIGNNVNSYNDSNQLNIIKWLLGIVSIIVLIIIIYLFYNK